MIRVDPQRLIEVADGLVELTLLRQRGPKVRVGVRMRRIQFQRRSKMTSCTLDLFAPTGAEGISGSRPDPGGPGCLTP